MKLWKRVPAAMLAALLCVPACSTVPAFEAVRAEHSTAGHSPRMVGARGPLSDEESRRILARLKREAPDADILTRHLAFEEAVARTPLTAGNKITVLRDGEQTYRAIWRAIRAARDHVNLEFFIFEDIEHEGKGIVDLLLEKQAKGVAIALIYDSIGSQETPGEVFGRLRDGGVKVLEFNPVNPVKRPKARLYSPNDRDHRKIVVADGRTAITGGINISSTYSTSAIRADEKRETDARPWRDTDIQIEGPVVADIQRLFLDTWTRQKGEPLPERTYFPRMTPAGAEVARAIGSTPSDDPPAFYVTFLSAIRNAETRIWIANSYFAPTEEVIEGLVAASGRDVDVRLLLQGDSDAPKVRDAARSYYSKFLAAGIRVYEYQDAVLHAKTAVIDGVWSVIGSSNIDTRSVIFNDEIDIVVLGRKTARQLEAHFEQDLDKSKEIDAGSWADRPFTQKVKELFWRLWAPLM